MLLYEQFHLFIYLLLGEIVSMLLRSFVTLFVTWRNFQFRQVCWLFRYYVSLLLVEIFDFDKYVTCLVSLLIC